MAVYEALLLNTVVPQIQAAQAGDSYVMVVNATTPALRITQTGTGNALEVEDSSNPDATPFVVTAAGDVGVGTSSPTTKLHVSQSNAGNYASVILLSNSADAAADRTGIYGSSASGNALPYRGGITFWPGAAGKMTFHTGNNAAPGDGQVMELSSSGNLGLGVTPSASGALGYTKPIQLGDTGAIVAGFTSAYTAQPRVVVGANSYFDDSADTWEYIQASSQVASQYRQYNGIHSWHYAAAGTAGNPISFTQAMTLDASGNLLVGVTSASYSSAGRGVTILGGSASGLLGFQIGGVAKGYVAHFDSNMQIWNDTNTPMLFATNGTERARITSGGDLLVGTTNTDPVGSNVTGHAINSTGVASHSRSEGVVLYVNRKTDDGVLVGFYQDGTAEGDISVSGTTVSYNGGHLSRWAQMLDKPLLLKGTVMSNLNEMNEYYKDGQPVANEQLNKVKVSDVEGDPNVAGVFVNWGHDEAHDVDEINMAMTGDMIIRIAQGVTVARGDLLMSAGDGTAKPQGDDIVRSKTVAKVTSTHVTCTYADGSYCVPCVLMAC
jgi:hypothetical protein